MKHGFILALALALWTTLLPAPTLAAPPLQATGLISSPAAGATLRGVVSIQGSATHPDFWKYEVHLAPGANSSLPDSQWIRLAVREQAVENGTLATWDTQALPDGPYTLRLRVVRRDGNWDEVGHRTLFVSNAAPPTPTSEPSPTPSPTSEPSPTPALTSTPQASPTPFAAATMAPSDGSGSGAPPSEAQALPASVDIAASPTPITIDQPMVVVLTQTSGEEEEEGTETAALSTSVASSASAPLSLSSATLVDSATSALHPGTLFGACFMGAGLSATVFLLAGGLYLARSMLRLFH